MVVQLPDLSDFSCSKVSVSIAAQDDAAGEAQAPYAEGPKQAM